MAHAKTASPLTLLAPDGADLPESLSTPWETGLPGNRGSYEGELSSRAFTIPELSSGHHVYSNDHWSVSTLDDYGDLLDFGEMDEDPAQELPGLPSRDQETHIAAFGGASASSTGLEQPSPDTSHDLRLQSVIGPELDRESAWQPIAELSGSARQARTGDDVVWYHGPREVTIVHDGLERSFIVDVPPGFDPGQSYSAVFAFHGANMTGASMVATTGISELADQRNFIAVYPNAADAQWNDGRATTEDGIDDVGFVQAIIAELEANWGLDPENVYATGVSSGGMFVQRLALEASEDFSAFAVVAANLPEALARSSEPSEQAPMVFFQGTEDQVVPFDGGEVLGGETGLSAGGTVLSAGETVEFWATANGTTLDQFEFLPDTVDDGTTVSVRASEDGSTVEYVIAGGGHNWPGMDVDGLTGYAGTVSQEIDATAVMIDFFEDYGL